MTMSLIVAAACGRLADQVPSGVWMIVIGNAGAVEDAGDLLHLETVENLVRVGRYDGRESAGSAAKMRGMMNDRADMGDDGGSSSNGCEASGAGAGANAATK